MSYSNGTVVMEFRAKLLPKRCQVKQFAVDDKSLASSWQTN
jgi:hypothetical protein